MLSKYLERRDYPLYVSVYASGFSTETSLVTNFIWGSNQHGNYPSTGPSTSATTTSVPTVTPDSGSKVSPDSMTDAGGSFTGSNTGASSTGPSYKSVTYASTSIRGGVSSTTQNCEHGSSSSSTGSGSSPANTLSATSSTVFRPTPVTTSDTTSEPASYYSAPGSNCILTTTTYSVVNGIPVTTLMSNVLSSSTLNRPNGQNTGGSPTSPPAGSPETPAVTGDGFLPSSSDVNQLGRISSGAVAVVSVIGAVILAILLLLLIRRYHRVRRQWRLAHIRRAGWNTTFSSGGRTDDVSAVTSYVNRTPLSFTDPVPPPMAEIRDDHGLSTHNSGKPRYSTHPPRPLLLDVKVSSHSDTRGAHSNAIPSNFDSSYLVMPDGLAQLQPEIATPMSVRPFTPSESFSFPKPPSNGEWIKIPNRDSHGTALSSSTEMYPPSLTNPSSGPESPITSGFCPVEMIHRTFVPSRYDEMSVSIGDRVKILEVFDDGWAMVEKVPEGNGKGKDVDLEPGLIPIDCLRMTGDPLPPFLAAKRISSQISPDVAV
ncbi:uncharacterized protein EV420DRAFT_817045 [Desarmillaria tabescens]|uniref:SH3 domain-containing protein n=1 Tax=Armillaria tabescens TaxID=1929756 RepID=A0AA39NIF9_ARMTA|nr:uncharacterized protein EV420DRAFT_817045 [Desarmillaria tabescens]KAK0466231.1 hypothetical protein EV420DRAFT_817045 [Desarmillaria tabescens]